MENTQLKLRHKCCMLGRNCRYPDQTQCGLKENCKRLIKKEFGTYTINVILVPHVIPRAREGRGGSTSLEVFLLKTSESGKLLR